MATICFARVDHRLIHGQVITKWIKLYSADRIVIIDDNLAADDFMADIYRMAAPDGIEVDVVRCDVIAQQLSDGSFGDDKLFVLFKSIASVDKATQAGLTLPMLQLGGIPYEPERSKVLTAVALLPQELDVLERLSAAGCEVYAQIIPDEARLELSDIAAKMASA